MKLQTYKTNLDKSQTRQETIEGIDYTVYPVVMMVEGAYYNGGLVTCDEMYPEAWNGRPVTNSHPSVEGEFVSANTKEMIENFKIGMLLNARIDGVKLKADAFINMAKVPEDLKKMLDDPKGKLDVSTGYFCKSLEDSGQFNGKEYFEVHKDLKPDHLAFLPNEEGACSWNDGAGVRVNSKGLKMKINEALRVLSNALNINQDKEVENMKFEDIIKMTGKGDAFTEDDRAALAGLSDTALAAIYDAFPEEEMQEMMDKEEDPETMADDKEKDKMPETMSAKDREALAFARNFADEQRKEFVKTISANSGMKANTLNDLPLSKLKEMAAQVSANSKAADYSAAVGAPVVNAKASDEIAAFFKGNE